MDKPHKAHHKASTGGKLAKKDAAKGVDRSEAKGYNPKVSKASGVVAVEPSIVVSSE